MKVKVIVLGLLLVLASTPIVAAAVESWTKLTDDAPWGTRFGSSVAVYDDKIWIIGGFGFDDEGEFLHGDMWTTNDGVNGQHLNDYWGTEVPDGIANAAIVVHDAGTPEAYGQLYVMGGITFTDVYYDDGVRKLTGGHTTRTIYRIATNGNVSGVCAQGVWESEFYPLSAVSFNGKVWVHSAISYGVQERPGEKIFYATDPLSPSDWASADIAVPPRRMGSMVSFKDKLWIMGGESFLDDYPYYIWKSDVWSSDDGINWTLVTDDAGWDPRGMFQVVAWRDNLWLMGGRWYQIGGHAYTHYNDVWTSADGANWVKVEDAPWTPRFAQSSVVYNDTLYLFGGIRLGNLVTPQTVADPHSLVTSTVEIEAFDDAWSLGAPAAISWILVIGATVAITTIIAISYLAYKRRKGKK